MYRFLLSLSLLLLASNTLSALDLPQSAVERRELQQQLTDFAAANACQSRLAICQEAVHHHGSAPYEEWDELLSRLDVGSDAKIVVDFRFLFSSLAATNFTELTTSVGDITASSVELSGQVVSSIVEDTTTALRSGLGKLRDPVQRQEIAENGVNFFVNFLNTFLNLLSGFIQFDVTPLTNLIAAIGLVGDTLVQIGAAIPAGPAAVINVLVVNFTPLILDLLTGLVDQLLGPEDPETATAALCSSSVIECSVDRMVTNILPSFIGSIFVIEGSEGMPFDTVVTGP